MAKLNESLGTQGYRNLFVPGSSEYQEGRVQFWKGDNLGSGKKGTLPEKHLAEILRVLLTVISKVENRWSLGLSQMAFFSLKQNLVRLSQTL